MRDVLAAPAVPARSRLVLHVDMDAFFASVEVLDTPSLAGLPVVVGGTGDRSVVASCSYEARAFGVAAAMSTHEARRRCPHAVFLPGRFWRYSEVSEVLHRLLARFSPLVEGVGLDEAYLDVTGSLRRFASPLALGWELRSAVADGTGLSCSVGLASSKLLAKLASGAAKPVSGRGGTRPGKGVVHVAPEEEEAFLWPHPIRALPGVGPVSARKLESLGVSTVGDLARVPPGWMSRYLGRSAGVRLAELARCVDPRAVVADRAPRSIGQEETFPRDLRLVGDLLLEIARLSDALGARLGEVGLVARSITIKVRLADRRTITRSRTFDHPVRSSRELRHAARELLLQLAGPAEGSGPGLLSGDARGALGGGAASGAAGRAQGRAQGRAASGASGMLAGGVRLLGVSASGLEAATGSSFQMSLFDGDPEARDGAKTGLRVAQSEALEVALSKVRSRYGVASVGPTALLGPHGLRVKRRGESQWGPGESESQLRVGESR
ncbi:MAG: DNA polymerase IV [Actinobacteria bacterium]|nr:DNA polymerase IV [Actinomycetota bacterium]